MFHLLRHFKHCWQKCVFSLSLLLILASCATQQERFGSYPVKGICRSCKPHKIRGAWYTPQLFYDYDETAIASWYGPGFHGKQKANGEVFDQYNISAAHKTLPLPTVVKVTNLENGKTINLVVDDRGPYVENRIIDLSVGAAKAIGMYGKGTAKVRVQSLPGHSHALSMRLAHIGNRWGFVKGRTWRDVYLEDIVPNHEEDTYAGGGSSSNFPVPGYSSSAPKKKHAHVEHERATTTVPLQLTKSLDELVAGHVDPAPPASSQQIRKKAASTGKYVIHLASFVQKPNALKLADDVKGLAQVRVSETVVPPGQKFFVVVCGPYPTEDAAQIALTSLDILGHNPRLIKE